MSGNIFYDINGDAVNIGGGYDVEQHDRRLKELEIYDPFTWNTFNKSYFVFVHDDSNAFIQDAYNAFNSENVPLSEATIFDRINNVVGNKTIREWLELISQNGEILMHYNYDLLETTSDDIWYEQIVAPKIALENMGFNIYGLILANSSDRNSAKGESFCRKYYTYADKVGTSLRYNLGRTLMLNFNSLNEFKAEINAKANINGLHAYGFHSNLRADESWITPANLVNIIRYIKSKPNTVITTYNSVFNTVGISTQNKRLNALEA